MKQPKEMDAMTKFESWLQEQFLIDCPETLDDNISDKFNNWVAELDQDSLIAYCLEYISQNFTPNSQIKKIEVNNYGDGYGAGLRDADSQVISKENVKKEILDKLDYLNENSSIDYDSYSELFDFITNLLSKPTQEDKVKREDVECNNCKKKTKYMYSLNRGVYCEKHYKAELLQQNLKMNLESLAD